jgi:hypothetical protein
MKRDPVVEVVPSWRMGLRKDLGNFEGHVGILR